MKKTFVYFLMLTSIQIFSQIETTEKTIVLPVINDNVDIGLGLYETTQENFVPNQPKKFSQENSLLVSNPFQEPYHISFDFSPTLIHNNAYVPERYTFNFPNYHREFCGPLDDGFTKTFRGQDVFLDTVVEWAFDQFLWQKLNLKRTYTLGRSKNIIY